MNLTFVLELNQEKNYENLSQSVIDIFNIFINEVPNCPLEVFFSCMPPKFLICLFLWEFFLTVYKNKYKFIILIHIMKIKPFNNIIIYIPTATTQVLHINLERRLVDHHFKEKTNRSLEFPLMDRIVHGDSPFKFLIGAELACKYVYHYLKVSVLCSMGFETWEIWFLNIVRFNWRKQGFKNRTGLANSTRNRAPIYSCKNLHNGSKLVKVLGPTTLVKTY